jgi:hypothetical protein
MGEKANGVYRFVEKCEGGRPPERLSINWKNNIKLDFKEIRRDCVDWDQLALDRDKGRAVVKTVMYLRVSKMRRIF